MVRLFINHPKSSASDSKYSSKGQRLRTMHSFAINSILLIFGINSILFCAVLSQSLTQPNLNRVGQPLMANAAGLVDSRLGSDLLVETSTGTAQGEYKSGPTVQTVQVRQFIGIPYAQKPIGYYRFSVS